MFRIFECTSHTSTYAHTSAIIVSEVPFLWLRSRTEICNRHHTPTVCTYASPLSETFECTREISACQLTHIGSATPMIQISHNTDTLIFTYAIHMHSHCVLQWDLMYKSSFLQYSCGDVKTISFNLIIYILIYMQNGVAASSRRRLEYQQWRNLRRRLTSAGVWVTEDSRRRLEYQLCKPPLSIGCPLKGHSAYGMAQGIHIWCSPPHQSSWPLWPRPKS